MDGYRSRIATSLAWTVLLAFCATTTSTASSAADAAAVANADGSVSVTLPPISSIGPGSDIRAFLALGVPEEVRRAALRRAWATDPAIHNFVGLSENSEDRQSTDTVESKRQISHSPLTQDAAAP